MKKEKENEILRKKKIYLQGCFKAIQCYGLFGLSWEAIPIFHSSEREAFLTIYSFV